MTALIGCLKTPTRQVPSSLMPAGESSAGDPTRLQVNFVSLYLPATISPGPFQVPETDSKKALSRVAAEALDVTSATGDNAAAARPHTKRNLREYMDFPWQTPLGNWHEVLPENG